MSRHDRARAAKLLTSVDTVSSGGEDSKPAPFVREPSSGGSNVQPHLSAFGFSRNPFPVVPDVNGFYLSRRSEAILAEVLHTIESRKGFMVLTGEVGLGKTTLSRRILVELEERGIRAALVFNTFHQGADLLREVNRDFGLDVDSLDLRTQLETLNEFLLANLAAGVNCAIIIDDAQQLSTESLELVRQVSNLETDSEKLVQILLIGQPELEETLEAYELRQLASRIVLSRRVEPFNLEETTQYVEFKLAQAAGYGRLKVTPQAFRRLHALSGGNPRKINSLMDRCLYAAIVFDTDTVDRHLLSIADRDVRSDRDRGARSALKRVARVVGLLLLMGALAALVAGPWRAKERVADVWTSALGKVSAARTQPVTIEDETGGASLVEMDRSGTKADDPSRAPAGVEDGTDVDPDTAFSAAGPVRVSQPAAVTTAGMVDSPVSTASVEVPEVPAASGGDTDVDRLAGIESFLDAYALRRHTAEFVEALSSGWMDEISARIRLTDGLRLVSLPSLPEDITDYEVFELRPSSSEIGAAGTVRFLLFWRPTLWSAANQYFQYKEAEVRALQGALQTLGHYDGVLDGLPGPITSTAIRRFQTAMNLTPSGIPDTETLFLLELRGVSNASEAEPVDALAAGEMLIPNIPIYRR